jgi:hypothetical protein
MVCYDFPGIGTDGVIRTYQFAKNLSHFGWQPIILKSNRALGDREDDLGRRTDI